MNAAIAQFAPVTICRIDRKSFAEGIVRGYAAPESGPKPCRVEVAAGGRLMAVAIAGGFSEMALQDGIRLGWCRFILGGVRTAAAITGSVALRCGVSGRVLEEITIDDLEFTKPKRARLTVPAYREFVSNLSGCTGIEEIYPFLEAYLAARGERTFLEAMYRYLMCRSASAEEIDQFTLDLPFNWTIQHCWDKLCASPEFSNHRQIALPGIFAPNFPFGHDLLGHAP